MADITTELQQIKAMAEKGKTEKTTAEANHKTFSKQRDEIVADLVQDGVKPEDLDAELASIDQEMWACINESKQLMGMC